MSVTGLSILHRMFRMQGFSELLRLLKILIPNLVSLGTGLWRVVLNTHLVNCRLALSLLHVRRAWILCSSNVKVHFVEICWSHDILQLHFEKLVISSFIIAQD